MITQDPEAGAHVVCNLGILLAIVHEQLDKDVEPTLLHKVFSKFVDL